MSLDFGRNGRGAVQAINQSLGIVVSHVSYGEPRQLLRALIQLVLAL